MGRVQLTTGFLQRSPIILPRLCGEWQ